MFVVLKMNDRECQFNFSVTKTNCSYLYYRNPSQLKRKYQLEMNNALWKVISLGKRRDPTCTHLFTIEFRLIKVDSRASKAGGGGVILYIELLTHQLYGYIFCPV